MRIQKIQKVRWLLILLFSVTATLLHAQYDNIWTLTLFSGCGDNGHKSTLDFNSGLPVYNIPPAPGIPGIYHATATMCDGSGQLLFYTDGTKVWDRNYNLMPNGNDLLGFPLSNGSNCFGSRSGRDGGGIFQVAIIQIPFQPQRYYIFYVYGYGDPGSGGTYGSELYSLYYSILDMSLNDGLGDVIAGQKGILLDNTSNGMAVVKGNDCRNAWLVTGQKAPGINAYEITSDGLNTSPVFSPVGLLNNNEQYHEGPSSLVASLDGHKLARGSSNDYFFGPVYSTGLETYDFDPATGQASNTILLSTYSHAGAAFSPDGTKLYADFLVNNYANQLRQYDLTASDPAAATILGVYPYLSCLKSGPDNKVYFFHNVLYGLALTMGCIEQPNLAGDACSFNPNLQLISDGDKQVIFPVGPVLAFSYDSLLTTHDIGPVCFDDTFRLTAQETGGWDYVWNTGDTDTALTVTGSGDYYVTYFTSCRLHTDTFHVTILGGQLPELHAEAGCRGDSNARVWATPAPGDAAEYSYTWYHNGQLVQGPDLSTVGDTLANALSGTTYHLLFQAPTGCAQGLDIAVPTPGYEATFQVDTIVCEGKAVQFSNTSTPDITGYSWGFGDGTTSDQANPVHTYTNPGAYTVQLIGSTGLPCYDTTRQAIIVDPVLEGGFSVSRDSICTGESITISPWSDSGVLRMGWTFGDGSAFARHDVQPFKHAFDVAGVLPVSLALGSRACPDVIITDTVHVYPLPVVNLGPDTSLCLNGAPVYLQNQYTTDENIRSVVWSTGDTARELKVVHPGVYSLMVKTAPIGCSNTDEVEVKKDCYIDIPNVFSPNGDGVNDYFFPRQLLSKKLTAFRMQVLNRWGQVVFEATSIEGRGWDGRFNNMDQPAGVYVYVIDVTIDDDRKEHYEGNVTLLR